MFLVFTLTSGLAQNTITGRVTDGDNPLSNVHVTNLTTETGTSTDKEGRYNIKASPREELRFTYVGMDTITIIVEDVTRILNIAMLPKVEMLDEVVVTEKISKQKNLAMNYNKDSSIVNTSFGYLSPASTAYHLKVIDGSEFNQGSDVLYAIASRRSGIKVENHFNSFTGQFVRTLFLRGGATSNNKSPALFEVDGNIFNDPPIWLDISNIKRVGIIPGVQAVWRYGPIARGGVVIINTSNGVHGLREKNSSKHYDQARLRNNFVTGKVVSRSEIKNELPTYLKEMENSSNLENAFRVYQKYRQDFSGIPYFYLDSYKLFFEKYGKVSADTILKDGLPYFESNPVWIKTLAFIYESQSRFEHAHHMYKKAYLLRPDYTQSFIDLAKSYQNIGDRDQANSVFARLAYLIDKGLISSDSTELSQMIEREMEDLFETQKESNTKGLLEQFSTRLVFEWNDSEAEFDLQFVNPDNQYFNWKHTLVEMPERIRSEKKLGYSMSDFLLDDELQGTWKVNTTYHGNKQLTPSYLKVTIYRNYGSKLQSKEINIYRLGTKGANQHLFDFNLPSRLVQSSR
ncbi:carboxypeptidase-like regulatory domain-containing protein [Flagellimonas profundi]|uniref:Carboxypeptidase-like regulatory domain-containing protein n=1 Tax=Flagellimonas profundi TaxID=2915620 RepID=A0ABS3FCB2_9FLAO|nr:carboxypeptidase-like regulatory domain-containing protein [Allomuricauda profundi]MBO0340804.1 carboxypeptidase-like regulatory domain-containing protein [Allomuricauda profundi]